MRNFIDALADACEKGQKTFTLNERNEMKLGVTTFQKGFSYDGTAKNINEKLNTLSKQHQQKINAESIVSIDFGQKILFYKFEDKCDATKN